MTTQTQTLAEFLLARIAEDEEACQYAQVSIPPARDAFGDWATIPGERRPGSGRRLAECEAKRRIVQDFEILHRDYRVTHDPTTEARRFQARVAMARLALPYADHPDYRDEWRV